MSSTNPLGPGLLDALPDNLLVSGPDGLVFQANARARQSLNLGEGELQIPLGDLFPFRDPDLGPVDLVPFEDIARSRDGREFRVLVRHGPAEDNTLWLFTDLTLQQDDRQGMIDYMADLTSAQTRIREYTRQIEVFRQIVDGMDQGVILTDPDQRVGFSNAFANRLFGMELTGRLVGDLKSVVSAAGVDLGAGLKGEVLVLNEALGRQTRCYLNVAPLNRGGSGAEGMVVWTFFELTEEIANTQAFIDFSSELAAMNRDLKEKSRQILQVSRTDTLTGVANRRTILEVLTRALEFSSAHRQNLSVLQFDLNQLKAVNDRLGQGAGDRALQEVCRSAEGILGDTGTLGRYGDGKFLAVLPGLEPGQATVLAEEIRSRVSKTETQGTALSVTIGSASARDGEGLESLVQRIDRAMTRAKAAGGNRVISAD
jgi:diguanylate cyclase (GGDEF)-like protein